MFVEHDLPLQVLHDNIDRRPRERRCRRLANAAVRCLFGRPDQEQTNSDLIRLGERLLAAKSRHWNFDFSATSAPCQVKDEDGGEVVDDDAGVSPVSCLVVPGHLVEGGCVWMTPETGGIGSPPRYEWTLVEGHGRFVRDNSQHNHHQTVPRRQTGVTDENVYGSGTNFDVHPSRRLRSTHSSPLRSSPLTTSSDIRFNTRTFGVNCSQSFVPTPPEGLAAPSSAYVLSSTGDRSRLTNLQREIIKVCEDRCFTSPTVRSKTHIFEPRDNAKRKKTIPDFFPCKKSVPLNLAEFAVVKDT